MANINKQGMAEFAFFCLDTALNKALKIKKAITVFLLN